MADDVQANIGLNIDTSKALTGLKALQSELSALHTQLSRLGPTQRAQAAGVQRSLIDNINATGKFAASMTTVKTTAESFTNALEKNKLTMGEYFRYAGGASKSFGRSFAREFATIEKVAVERVKSLQTQYIKLGRDANGAMKAIQVRPLALDMNNLQTKTAIAAQKQQLLNQLLKQGSTQMLNWGKNTQWAGRQLMVGFTIPLGIFAGKAMQAFSDMEKQIISFKRVYGDLSTSAKDTDAMAESIRRLAGEFTKYGLAVSDTMEMASKAAAMGKTGADLLGQVQQASKLAVLGQVEQQQALQTTISLTDTFGTAAEDLGKKINFLNAVENQTAVSIEDLTIAIPKAGPVIKQLGGDVEDLAFFLTAMREGGINASEGANALKSGLAAMINPTGKAKQMLQGFGINLEKIVKTNKGDVRGTVTEFAKALDKLDPLNRAKAIEQLFGKFQFARISTLMKNVASDSSQAATTAQLAQKSSIELAALAARELRQLSSSPLYKFQKAIQDFQTQLAPIGEAFMKFVTPIIDWVNGILKAFNGLSDGTKTFIVGFTSIVAGLGPVLLMTFGLVANGFANLIKGFAALKSMFNRVQTSSEILGQETRYMTEEQIKAKAVAASLDQVHGKLIQTFNVEAGSVNKLASAYERAVLASQRLMPVATGGKGKAGPTKKFANGGIIRGPGTGTSDSIIARVSNREAIIPAKNVAKYPDLVNSLIDGNIPGFSVGKRALGARLKKKTKTEFAPDAIRKQSRDMKWQGRDEELAILESLAAEMGIDLNSEQSKKQRIRENYLGVDASHLNEDTTSRDIGFGASRSFKNWRPKNLFADYGVINKSINDLKMGGSASSTGGKVKAQFAEKLQTISTSLDMDPKEVDSIAKKIFKGGHVVTQKQRAVAEKIMGLAVENATTPLEKFKYTGAQRILKRRAKGKFYNQEEIAKRGYTFSEESNRRYQDQAVSSVSRELANAEKSERDEFLKTAASKQGQRQTEVAEGKKQIEATRRSTKAKKETAQADESVAKSSKETAKEYLTRAREERKLNKKLTVKQKRVLAEYDAIQAQAAEKRRATIANKRSKSQAQEANMLRLYGTVDPTQEQIQAVRDQKKIDEKARKAKGAERKASMNKKPSLFGFGKASQNRRTAGAAKYVGGMRGFGVGTGIAMAGGLAASVIPDQNVANMVGIGAQVAGVASMFPKLALGIARFLPGIGIAVTALTGLAFVVDKLGEAERQRAKSIKAQAKAANMSKEDKSFFGDFFGKATTSSYISSITATADQGITDPMSMAASEMRKSEDFKKNYKEIIDELKTASTDNANLLISNLSLGLSKDFAKDEISVIVKALQDEAGRTDINLQFAVVDVTTDVGRQAAQKAVEDSLAMLKSFSSQTYTESSIIRDLYVANEQAMLAGVNVTPIDNISPVSALDMLPQYRMQDAYKQFLEIKGGIQGKLEESMAAGDDTAIAKYSGYLKQVNTNIENFLKNNPAFTDALSTASGSISSTFDALESALDRGDITMTQYQDRVNELINTVSRSDQGPLLVETLIRQLSVTNPEIAKTISGIKSVRGQLAGVLALASGANVEKVLALINAIKSAETLGLPTNKLEADLQALIGNIPAAEKVVPPPGDGENPRITAANKKIDKYQAGIDLIAIAEEKINKKYDKRIEALDKVQELNDQISQQQRDQLDLADALSRGDIGAAASAAQTMRANEQNLQIQRQRDNLDAARRMELDAVTDPLGRTRSYLEGKIAVLEEQIAKINFWAVNKKPKNAATGGMINHYRPGGSVMGPGTGTSDDIPAMLSNGEYVIRAKAVKALGVDTLDRMNHAEKFGIGGFARRFAKGGKVVPRNARMADRADRIRQGLLPGPVVDRSDKKKLSKFRLGEHKASLFYNVPNVKTNEGMTPDYFNYDGNYKEVSALPGAIYNSFTDSYEPTNAFREIGPGKYAFHSAQDAFVYYKVLMQNRRKLESFIKGPANDYREKDFISIEGAHNFTQQELIQNRTYGPWNGLDQKEAKTFAKSIKSLYGPAAFDSIWKSFGLDDSLLSDKPIKLDKEQKRIEKIIMDGHIYPTLSNNTSTRLHFADGGIVERLRAFRNNERKKFIQPSKSASLLLPQMLKRTKLAARTTQDALMSMIAGDGRYKNAFETGSGEDFKDVNENSRAKWTRLNMEADALGIPKSAKPQARPTYGSLVTDSKILESLNRTLGGKTGKRFNLVSDINSDQLDRYGDISLITKNRVKNRSTFYTGDTLETYARNGLFGRDNFGPVPISGKKSDILKRAALDRLNMRFGTNKIGENAYSINNKPRYFETQTPGGFTLDEIAKIRVHSSDDAARDVFNELRNSGIKTKVYGPSGRVRGGMLSGLLRTLGRIGGPEGMFLADALLGTSSMGMPNLPGQSRSPFASGAYAMGGMVGKYADGGRVGPGSADADEKWTMAEYIKRPLTLHNSTQDMARKRIDNLISRNKLSIPAGSSILRVANTHDAKALSLLKPGQSAILDQFLSITTPNQKADIGNGTFVDFVEGMRDGTINTGGRYYDPSNKSPLIKFNVKSDVPGILDMNPLLDSPESNVVDGLLARGQVIKLRKVSTAKDGSKTYHIDLDSKNKASLGLNEILWGSERAETYRKIRNEEKNGEIDKARGYSKSSSPQSFLEDIQRRRTYEAAPGIDPTSPNMWKSVSKLFSRFGRAFSVLGGPEFAAISDYLFGTSYLQEMTGMDFRNPLGSKGFQTFDSEGRPTLANGGMVSKIKPSYFNAGGYASGTDTIPAMLTPGEFVMSRSAVQNFGVDNLKAINSGQALQSASANSQTSVGDSVYNSNSYSISVNVSSASDPNDIARTVMAQIQRIDAQTTRSNRY